MSRCPVRLWDIDKRLFLLLDDRSQVVDLGLGGDICRSPSGVQLFVESLGCEFGSRSAGVIIWCRLQLFDLCSWTSGISAKGGKKNTYLEHQVASELVHLLQLCLNLLRR